jgi:hypothetical protein
LDNGTISTSGASGMTLDSSSILTGVGTINGDVHHAGILIPGAPTGTLFVSGDFELQSTAMTLFQIDATTTSVQTSRVNVGGIASLDGLLFIGLSGDINHVQQGTPIVIVHGAGGVNGEFAGVPEGMRVDVLDLGTSEAVGKFTIHYGDRDVELNAVPEPAVGGMILVSMILNTRRKRRG